MKTSMSVLILTDKIRQRSPLHVLLSAVLPKNAESAASIRSGWSW